MVFKVKKRVAIDFERQRRSLETSNTASMPVYIQEKYSYNWPYDYCSLVELAQIEESVQWSSRDLHTEEPVVIDYEPPAPRQDTTPGPSAAPTPIEYGQRGGKHCTPFGGASRTGPTGTRGSGDTAHLRYPKGKAPTRRKAKSKKNKGKPKRHKGKGKKR